MPQRVHRSILVGLISILLLVGCAGSPAPVEDTVEARPSVESSRVKLSTQTPSPSPETTTTLQPTIVTPIPSQALGRTHTPTARQDATEPAPLATVQYSDIPTQTLAEIAYDFLFVSQGAAYRWSHVENSVFPLLENGQDSLGSVVTLAADADQNKILLHRSKGIAANGVELYDLLHYRYDTGEIRTILQETGRMYTLRVSPDGRWLGCFDQAEGGAVLFVALESTGETNVIGECGAEESGMCGGLAWSPDSKTLLWMDERGIWGYSPERQELSKIMGPEVEIQNSQGLTSTVQVQFTNPLWSPFGRYILARVRPDRSQVSWLDIIDIRTGRAAEVPGTFRMEGNPAQAAWLRDGRLLIVDQSDRASGFQLLAFHPNPTRPGLLRQEEQTLTFSDPLEGIRGAGSMQFVNPAAISERFLTIRYVPQGIGTDTGLLSIDLEFGSSERLSSIPQDTIEIAWSPEGEQAILVGKHGSVFLLHREGKQLYNMLEIVPGVSDQFLWTRSNRFVGGS